MITLNLDGLPTTSAALSTEGGVTKAVLSLTIPTGSTLHQHNLQATYAGDANYSASTLPAVTVNVDAYGTSSVVSPATTTPYATDSLVLTATVTPGVSGSAAPTGTFTFTLDGVAQGTADLVAGTPSTATMAIIVPGAGTHTVAGSYSGDSNYAGSTAQPVTISVSKGPTTLNLVPATNTPAPGAPLQVTANLVEAQPGNAAATGKVTFSMDGAVQGTAPVVSGTAATFTITAPATGTHTLEATYSGDTNYLGSTATPVSITVSKTPTSISLTPTTTTPAGGTSLGLSATVTPSAIMSAAITGTVTFTLDGVTVATVAIPSGSTTVNTTVTAPASGSHTLQASYSGDNNYESSVSPAVSITVTKISTNTTVSASTDTPAAGSSLQVTATITSATVGSAQLTGTVTFTVDGAAVGFASVSSTSPAMVTTTITAPSSGATPWRPPTAATPTTLVPPRPASPLPSPRRRRQPPLPPRPRLPRRAAICNSPPASVSASLLARRSQPARSPLPSTA